MRILHTCIGESIACLYTPAREYFLFADYRPFHCNSTMHSIPNNLIYIG